MLLTLNAACVRPLMLTPPKGRRAALTALDLPAFARETLGLSGLSLTTDMLAGFDTHRLEGLREKADKVGCSCLLLAESEPQAFADPAGADAAVARMKRVVQAANLLGCNSVAVRVKASDSDALIDPIAKRLRQVSEPAEKLDIALLIAPTTGLTSSPERLTELIKKVGGFRIGTFPDFQTAAAAKDPVAYLRRLCPYASAVNASTMKFKEGSGPDSLPTHESYDLSAMVETILSVGYDATLSVDYRGEGDITIGVSRSRAVLQAMLTETGAAE